MCFSGPERDDCKDSQVDCPDFASRGQFTSFNHHDFTLLVHLIMASGTHGVPEIVSTIQAASIIHHPEPHRDINPSTAASQREAVVVGSSPAVSDVEEDEIPISVLHPPPPRKRSLPPLPDLRFEQSYLRSIEHANGWGAVAYITIRDQVRVMMCDLLIYSHSKHTTLKCESKLTKSSGPTSSRPRYTMDAYPCCLETLEPSITLFRNQYRCKNT